MGGQVGHVSVGHAGFEEHAYVYNGDLITMVTNSQQNWQQKITSIVIVCDNMHRSAKC